MNKKAILKNVKIVNLVIILGIIGVTSSLFLGINAIYNVKSMNSRFEIMYKVHLNQVEQVGYINNYVGQLRTAITKIVFQGYSKEYEQLINDNCMKIEANIMILRSLGIKESDTLDTIIKDYDEYKVEVRNVVLKRKLNDTVPADILDKYEKIGSELTNNLELLIKSGETEAEKEYADASSNIQDIKYKNTVIIVSMMLLVISITSVIAISVRKSIFEFRAMLSKLAKGNFKLDMVAKENNEFGIMKKELFMAISSVRDTLFHISSDTEKINKQVAALSSISKEMATSSGEVKNSILEVSLGSKNQTKELFKIASTLDVFSNDLDCNINLVSTVNKNAGNISCLADSSNKDLKKLGDSLYDVQEVFKTVSIKVNTLNSSIREINEITKMINEVADKTNLLALNASIEAARAGEAGKGFAVVAVEIRKLAEQSKMALKEINNKVNNIAKESNDVITNTRQLHCSFNNQEKIINTSLQSFKSIIEAIDNIIPIIYKVNDSIVRLKTQKDEIVSKIEMSSQVAQENLCFAEEITVSSKQINLLADEIASISTLLSQIASENVENISRFKL